MEEAAVGAIFIGSEGLRAGWRLAIFLAAYFLAVFSFSWLLQSMAPAREFTGERLASLELLLFSAAVIATAIMGIIEKRSFAAYGLPARGAFGPRFWEGTVWGFLGLSILLLALHATGCFDLGGFALHGESIAKYGLLWAGIFLLVGLAEEFTFRGYALRTLSEGIGFWPSALVLSSLFGLAHRGNPGETWLGAFMAGFVGLFLCFTWLRTGSLWLAIGFHTGWDWGETFFYGVADSGQVERGHLLNSSIHGREWLSGGSVGPEGSVLALAVIAILFALFHFRFRRAHYRVGC